MRINELIPDISKSRIESQIRENLNYELLWKDIPDGYVSDGENPNSTYKYKGVDVPGDQLLYKWDLKTKNFKVNHVKNKTKDGKIGKGTFFNSSWEMMQPGPSRDEDGNLNLDKDGNEQMTQYTPRWRKILRMAAKKIKDSQDTGADKSSVIDLVPIKNNTTVTLPNNKDNKGKYKGIFSASPVTYKYDEKKNAWFNAGTKAQISRTDPINKILMAKFGYDIDGRTPLDERVLKQITTWVFNKFPEWLTKDGSLGKTSYLARNIGGVGGDYTGDILGRFLKKAYMGNVEELEQAIDDKQKKKDDENTPPEGSDALDRPDATDKISPQDNKQQLLLTFKRSKQINPDIKPGWQGEINGKKYTWYVAGKGANTTNQWIEQKTKQRFTVNPQVHASIIKYITADDLDKLNKGEQIDINGKPATPTQFLHAQLYAIYHQKNK